MVPSAMSEESALLTGARSVPPFGDRDAVLLAGLDHPCEGPAAKWCARLQCPERRCVVDDGVTAARLEIEHERGHVSDEEHGFGSGAIIFWRDVRPRGLRRRAELQRLQARDGGRHGRRTVCATSTPCRRSCKAARSRLESRTWTRSRSSRSRCRRTWRRREEPVEPVVDEDVRSPDPDRERPGQVDLKSLGETTSSPSRCRPGSPRSASPRPTGEGVRRHRPGGARATLPTVRAAT